MKNYSIDHIVILNVIQMGSSFISLELEKNNVCELLNSKRTKDLWFQNDKFNWSYCEKWMTCVGSNFTSLELMKNITCVDWNINKIKQRKICIGSTQIFYLYNNWAWVVWLDCFAVESLDYVYTSINLLHCINDHRRT